MATPPPPRYSEDHHQTEELLPPYETSACGGCRQLVEQSGLRRLFRFLGLATREEHVPGCLRWEHSTAFHAGMDNVDDDDAERRPGIVLGDDSDEEGGEGDTLVSTCDSDSDEETITSLSPRMRKLCNKKTRGPPTSALVRSMLISLLLLLATSMLALSLASAAHHARKRGTKDTTREQAVQALLERMKSPFDSEESRDLAELIRLRAGYEAVEASNNNGGGGRYSVWFGATFRARARLFTTTTSTTTSAPQSTDPTIHTTERISVIRILGRPAVLSAAFFRNRPQSPLHAACIHGRPPLGSHNERISRTEMPDERDTLFEEQDRAREDNRGLTIKRQGRRTVAVVRMVGGHTVLVPFVGRRVVARDE